MSKPKWRKKMERRNERFWRSWYKNGPNVVFRELKQAAEDHNATLGSGMFLIESARTRITEAMLNYRPRRFSYWTDGTEPIRTWDNALR